MTLSGCARMVISEPSNFESVQQGQAARQIRILQETMVILDTHFKRKLAANSVWRYVGIGDVR